MTFPFTCPKCGSIINCPDKSDMQTGRCPKCHQRIKIIRGTMKDENTSTHNLSSIEPDALGNAAKDGFRKSIDKEKPLTEAELWNESSLAQGYDTDPFSEMTPEWSIYINGKQQNKMTKSQISSAVSKGAISVSSLAWRKGMAEWQALEDIPEFAQFLKKASDPPSLPISNPPEQGQMSCDGESIPSSDFDRKKFVAKIMEKKDLTLRTDAVTCPDCLQVVSISAKKCPNCGAIVSREYLSKACDLVESQTNKNAMLTILGFGVILLLGLGYYLFIQTPMGRVEMGLEPRNYEELKSMEAYVLRKMETKVKDQMDKIERLSE